MRAVVVQCAPGACKAENVATLAPLIDAAAMGDRPALVSLPEMWTCLGAGREQKLSQSEMLPSPGGQGEPGSAYRFLGETARRLGVTLHGGSIGERAGETLFNTTLVFGPDGAELARYRKIHLFDVVTPGGQSYRESGLFGAGDQVVTCRAGGDSGPVLGLSICYDLRFAEMYSLLRVAGAEVILVPSAFTAETGRAHWEVLLRARAIETQCWVVAAATTGTHLDGTGRTRTTWGHSLICDPWGEVRADAGEAPGWAAAEIDLAELARVRAAMPVLAHRRLA